MGYDGPTDLYIDGEWTEGETGEQLPTVDPATGERYAAVAKAGRADVQRAGAAASRAGATRGGARGPDPAQRAAAPSAGAVRRRGARRRRRGATPRGASTPASTLAVTCS